VALSPPEGANIRRRYDNAERVTYVQRHRETFDGGVGQGPRHAARSGTSHRLIRDVKPTAAALSRGLRADAAVL